jgi:hypothetical protein
MGPVRLRAADHRDATPRSEKAQGLLALLGTSDGCRLTRMAAIDKLWSDRPAAQGRASLRQVLSAIRAAGAPDAVCTQGQWLILDPAVVTVDLTSSRPDLSVEFAEGLDIRDPEFENWLRDSRARFGQIGICVPAAARRPALLIAPSQGADTDLKLYGDIVLRDVATQASRMTGIVAQSLTEPDTVPRGTLVMRCRAVRVAGQGILQLSLERGATGECIWSMTLNASNSLPAAQLCEATEMLTLAVVNSMSEPAQTDGPIIFPMRDVFSFDAAALQRAERVLLAQSTQFPVAQTLALRAYLRHTQILERIAPDPDEALREGAELAREALVMAPSSALTLAVSSLFAGLQQDDVSALDLALRASHGTSHDPFVAHALSVAWSFAGDIALATKAAQAAQSSRLADMAPPIHALRTACVAIDRGAMTEALNAARLAIRFAPNFRAAYRIVSALEFWAGHEAASAAALRALKTLEPDFSLDLMASQIYPVDTLRRAGLLEVTRSGLL